MITINTILDMRPGAVPKIIHLSQYDSDFTLVFRLHASFGVLNIEGGTTAEIRGTKKSGTGYSASATLNISNGTVTVAGDAQMTAVAGQNIYEIVLIKNNKVLGSANFILLVERAALDADTITDASVLRELNAIIEGAETATQAAEDAEDAADRAEDAADRAEDAADRAEDAADRAEAASLTVDSALSSTSTNPVQNKVVEGSISDLNNQLNTLNTVDGVFDLSWEQGGLLSETGIEFNSDTSCRTKFLPVTPGSVVFAYHKLAGAYTTIYVYEFADNTTTASGVNERLYATGLSNGQPLKLSANTNYVRLRVNGVTLTDAKSKIALIVPGFILDRIYRGRDYAKSLSVLSFFDTSSLSSFGVSDMPRNTYTNVNPASKFTNLPVGVSPGNICVCRTNYNEAGNLSVVILYTREGDRLEDIYYGFYRESIPFSGFTKLNLNDEVDALEQFDADYITPHIKQKNYNLLDLDNIETINSYIAVNSETDIVLKHSARDVKTMIVPSVPGKTYTFTRKNATSRLIMGFGASKWTDTSDHALINRTHYNAPRMSLTRLTLQAPVDGNYLYIFFYRGESDASYDATLEEAMLTETAYPMPYVEYGLDLILDTTNRWETRKKIYGVEFDTAESDPACTRIADAVGVGNFDEVFPWCEMRRCAVSITNGLKSIIYEGETGYAVDGTAGNVMVEVPAFYVKRERYGTKERWLISGTQYGGFELHPWFIERDGTQVEYRYYGAYKACDETGNIFSASGKSVYNGQGNPLTTLVTKMQAAGYNRNTVNAFSAIQYLFTIEFATRNSQDIYNGSTYNPYFSTGSTAAFELVSSITGGNTLVLPNGHMFSGNSFLFYSAGMQVFIGTAIDSGEIRTVTAITFDSNNIYITVDGAAITQVEGLRCAGICQTPGQTDSLTEVSGYAIGQDSHVASFRYRGIENPWGCIWEVLDGLRLKNGEYYYDADPQAAMANMTPLTYTAPMISVSDHDQNNWIKTLGFDVNHRTVALPETPLLTDPGESITLKTDKNESVASGIVLRGQKYFCDAFYSSTNTSIELIPAVGGGWDHHENAGLFCMRFISDSTQNWLYGERLTC